MSTVMSLSHMTGARGRGGGGGGILVALSGVSLLGLFGDRLTERERL